MFDVCNVVTSVNLSASTDPPCTEVSLHASLVPFDIRAQRLTVDSSDMFHDEFPVLRSSVPTVLGLSWNQNTINNMLPPGPSKLVTVQPPNFRPTVCVVNVGLSATLGRNKVLSKCRTPARPPIRIKNQEPPAPATPASTQSESLLPHAAADIARVPEPVSLPVKRQA